MKDAVDSNKPHVRERSDDEWCICYFTEPLPEVGRSGKFRLMVTLPFGDILPTKRLTQETVPAKVCDEAEEDMALNILIMTTEVLNSKLTLSAGDSVMWQTSSYTASVAFTAKAPFQESFPASLSLKAPDKFSSSYTISGEASGTYSYTVTVNSSPANKISCSIKVVAAQEGEGELE